MSKSALWSRYQESRPLRGITVRMLSAADIWRGLNIPRALLARWTFSSSYRNPREISAQGIRPPVETASRSTTENALNRMAQSGSSFLCIRFVIPCGWRHLIDQTPGLSSPIGTSRSPPTNRRPYLTFHSHPLPSSFGVGCTAS